MWGSSSLSAWLMENRYHLYPCQSEQANKHELSLKTVWDYLLREFHRRDMSPEWRRSGILPHRPRSLLSLAVTAPYAISETMMWYIATSFYWGSTVFPHPFQCCQAREKFNSCHLYASTDSPRHCRMDSAIRLALEMYEETISKHRPSLVEVFLWNELDILPPTYADTLFGVGFRHGFFISWRYGSSRPSSRCHCFSFYLYIRC